MPELTPEGPLDPHRRELERLSAALAHRPQPDERAILAGALLTTAGHVLRRSQAAGETALDAARHAVASLERDDVQAWLGRASAAGLSSVLRRAVDAAFEISLADTDDERSQHREAALEGLAERERLACSISGLDAWNARFPTALDERARRRREGLTDEARKLDQMMRPSASALAALADERRAERDQLDSAHRDECWWYCRHVDDSALLGLFTGASADVPGLDARVRSAMATVEAPPRRHLTADELWDYDLGVLDEARSSWIRRRAADCPDWRRDLRALREGEEAIASEVSGTTAPRSGRSDELEPEQVAFDHPHFRAIVDRGPRRTRVFIEEKEAGALLAVASPADGLKPRRLARGFELQLTAPRGGSMAQALKLRVTLASREEVPVEVRLR